MAITNTSGQVLLTDGSIGTPAVAFSNDPDTGLYLAGTNTLGMNGHIIKPNTSAFSVFQNSTQLNATGNFVVATVGFGGTIFDQNGDVSGSTFTAPITGKYLFSINILLTAATGHWGTTAELRLVTSGGTYRSQQGWIANTTLSQMSGTWLVPMTASQTARVDIKVDGGAQDVSINAETTDHTATWSGTLIC